MLSPDGSMVYVLTADEQPLAGGGTLSPSGAVVAAPGRKGAEADGGHGRTERPDGRPSRERGVVTYNGGESGTDYPSLRAFSADGTPRAASRIGDAAMGLAVPARGGTGYLATVKGYVAVIDLARVSQAATIPYDTDLVAPGGIAVSADGTRLAVLGSPLGKPISFDLINLAPTAKV